MGELKMPKIGLGTYPLQGDILTNAVTNALECGYRMFDTAHNYGNEDHLGISLKIAMQKLGVKREDIFINTKVDEELRNGINDGQLFYKKVPNESKDIFSIVKNQVETSLKRLKTTYLDCVLIHWPYPDYLVEIWKALEILYKQGLINHIGVSNCRERHLRKIIENCEIVPMVNQVQISPVNTMQNLVVFCKENNIALQVYSPLMLLNTKLRNNNTLLELSKKYKCLPQQLILKWNLQNGFVPFPKSSNPVRIKQNITLDFEIEDLDMQKINSLNENYQYLPESIYCPGY
jgi:diketogulonate reductase-like aldo/keto reductase